MMRLHFKKEDTTARTGNTNTWFKTKNKNNHTEKMHTVPTAPMSSENVLCTPLLLAVDPPPAALELQCIFFLMDPAWNT